MKGYNLNMLEIRKQKNVKLLTVLINSFDFDFQCYIILVFLINQKSICLVSTFHVE